IGLNDETVKGLGGDDNSGSGAARFAWDCYRRLIQMYGDVVLNIAHENFEDIIDTHKRRNALKLDTEIDADCWKEIVGEFKQVVQRDTGKPFPQDPQEQ